MSKFAVAAVALIAVAFGNESVALLIVAVPVAAPSASVVAAPPMFTVVAPVLKRLPVVFVVESVPPFAAMLPVTVVSPVTPSVPATEVLPFDAVTENLFVL